MTGPYTVIDSLAVRTLLTIHDPEVSPQEILVAVAWIDASPENREAFDRAAAFWEQCEHSVGAILAAERSSERRHSGKRHWSPFGVAAAFTAVAASVGLLAIAIVPQFRALAPNRQAASEIEAYNTGRGEIVDLRLADGTRVTLGGKSSISFRGERSRRIVVLTDGDAIFDVVKDPRRPFTVYSGAGSTTALGTRFSVRKSPGGVKVTLAHGSVKVAVKNGEGGEIVLHPGAQATYNGDRIGAVKSVDVNAEMAWTSGKFYFSREPLSSVIYSLNRYTEKPIIIEGDKIANTLVSGIVDRKDMLHWLQAVAKVVGAEVVDSDKAVRILAPSGGDAEKIKRASIAQPSA